MQEALKNVAGVTEVVSVSDTEDSAVVKVKKGEVETTTLVDAIAAIEEVDGSPRFTATVAE